MNLIFEIEEKKLQINGLSITFENKMIEACFNSHLYKKFFFLKVMQYPEIYFKTSNKFILKLVNNICC